MRPATAKKEGVLSRERIRKANGWYLTVATFCELVKRTYDWGREKVTYSISVGGTDWLYDEVHRWVLEVVKDNEVRSLLVKTENNEARLASPNELPKLTKEMTFYADDTSRHSVRLDAQGQHSETGVRVDVVVVHPDKSSIKWENLRQLQEFERVTFESTSPRGRDAVKALLDNLLERKEGRQKNPTLKVASEWGGWTDRRDLPPRQLESVVLRKGLLEDLIEDLESFLREEQTYISRSLPWHRGYLLEGPPGTGKSSIPRALAHHFKMDCYALSLGDMLKDDGLLGLIGNVPTRSILVLEDVDVFHAATERDDEHEGASLSGLLNGLDGLSTPHGLITFITSNRAGALDEALLRPGRVDKRFFLDYVDQDQAERLFQHFYGRKPARYFRIPSSTLSPAEVVEMFKQHMHDPEAAERAYTHLIKAA